MFEWFAKPSTPSEKRRKSRFLTHSKPGTSSPSTNSFPKYFLARTPHEVSPDGSNMFEWFAKPSTPSEKTKKISIFDTFEAWHKLPEYQFLSQIFLSSHTS